MTQYLGIEISPEALGLAVEGRKIEAIRLVRMTSTDPNAYGYISLKAAKDAVEAAMADYDGTELRRRLDSALRVAADYKAANDRLRADYAQVEAVRARADAEVVRLRTMIFDHIWGTSVLPDLSPATEPDEMPF